MNQFCMKPEGEQVVHALEHALAYARKGWRVLPVEPRDKRPWKGNGAEHATTDEAKIRDWFSSANANLNIGIVLADAGLLAIDIDPRNGGRKELRDELPATLTARSGGDGLHLIYRVPAGRRARGKFEFERGVDIKSEGYIVVEPSVHKSAQAYEFYDWDPLTQSLPPIAEAPERALHSVRPQAPTSAMEQRENREIEWFGGVLKGENLHDNTRDLAASLIANGTVPGAVVTYLRALLKLSIAPHDSRFFERYGEIPRLVTDAEKKFAPLNNTAQSKSPFELVPILGGPEPSAPSWVWANRIPRRFVTLLSGHGGSGKSMIMLQLAIATSLGMHLFGIATEQCNVVIFSAEDDGLLLRHRLHHLCRCMGVNPADLEGKLLMLDATDGNPALFQEVTSGGRKTTTETYKKLREFVSGKEIGLLIVDNASDVYEANEIVRAEVRPFMRSLMALAREFEVAVVLLAHLDKRSARGEAKGSDTYSGSTAWHNSARSRMALEKQANGSLVLRHEKSNLTVLQDDLVLAWPENAAPTLADASLFFQGTSLVDRANLKVLLRLIYEYTAEGKFVTPQNSSSTPAARVLRTKEGYPTCLSDTDVEKLLKSALGDGYLIHEPHRSGDGHLRGGKHWVVTPAGLEFAELNDAAGGKWEVGGKSDEIPPPTTSGMSSPT